MGARPQPFRLGEWHAEPTLNRLRRGDEKEVHVEPRVMALLVHLVERAGEVVGKDELLREVWGGAWVEEVAVARAVSELRRVLGDDAANPRFVETIPKRGYRVIAPVELAPVLVPPRVAAAPIDNTSGRPAERHGVRWRRPLLVACLGLLLVAGAAALFLWRDRRAANGATRPMTSIAVLPLRNLSGDPAQQFFADGMTEVLTTDLSQIRALRVVSGASLQRLVGSPASEVVRRTPGSRSAAASRPTASSHPRPRRTRRRGWRPSAPWPSIPTSPRRMPRSRSFSVATTRISQRPTGSSGARSSSSRATPTTACGWARAW